MTEGFMTTMQENIFLKRDQLLDWFREFGEVFVAFSGGVDSSVLAKAAFLACPEGARAVFFESATSLFEEKPRVESVAAAIGIPLEILSGEEFADQDFCKNDEKRCYYCKRVRFSQLLKRSPGDSGVVFVEGSNADDLFDYRPGKKAAEELNVRAPLAELGFSKQEVRKLARFWNLPNWNLPSEPCLATRVDYDIELKPELLDRIREAEAFLKRQGISLLRVRYHGNDLVRIEVEPDSMALFSTKDFRENLLLKFQELGFRFITLDLNGFRSGSMDRPENTDKRKT